MEKAPIKKFVNPRIHKFIIRYLERLTKTGAVKKTKLFFGDEMNVVLPEIISETIYTYGFFDEIVTGLAINAVDDGDVVRDIGAHFSYFSLLFAFLVGDTGKVYSFEQTPTTFNLLANNVAERGNVIAVNYAAGAANGKCKIMDFGLKYNAWNTLSDTSRMPQVLDWCSGNSLEVNVIKLDDYLANNNITPDLIKIDAENFEFEVISGLETSILNVRPKIILEAGLNGSLKAGKLLQSLGYRVFVSNAPGDLTEWTNAIEQANSRYKDLLFIAS